MAMIASTDDLLKYYNLEKLPTIWCPGCGLGTVTRALVTAIHELGLNRQKIILVTGIGCSGRMSGYLDFSAVHVTHGRALAYATGIKMANPALHVIVIMGDGDASAIGGNHLIHAARRNIGLTALVCNNSIYGMTGGQYSPTTPAGDRTTTSPLGNIEPSFDLCDLVASAGASFVARGTAFHTPQLTSLIKDALSHDGFSFVEAVVQCPTCYGRKNSLKTPFSMLEDQKKRAVNISRAAKLSTEETEGKIITGVLKKVDRKEYTLAYAEMLERIHHKHVEKAERGGLASAADFTSGFKSALPGEGKLAESEEEATRDAYNSGSVSLAPPKDYCELRLSGSGGQGLVLAGIIIGEAAVREGFNVVQTQVYGPESRGGASRSEVIISRKAIDFPEVTRPNILLAMSQEACSRYYGDLSDESILLIDPQYVRKVPQTAAKVYPIPFTQIARDEIGKEIAANIVALGAVQRLAGLVGFSSLSNAVTSRVPRSTIDMNLAALEAGRRAAAYLSGFAA